MTHIFSSPGPKKGTDRDIFAVLSRTTLASDLVLLREAFAAIRSLPDDIQAEDISSADGDYCENHTLRHPNGNTVTISILRSSFHKGPGTAEPYYIIQRLEWQSEPDAPKITVSYNQKDLSQAIRSEVYQQVKTFAKKVILPSPDFCIVPESGGPAHYMPRDHEIEEAVALLCSNHIRRNLHKVQFPVQFKVAPFSFDKMPITGMEFGEPHPDIDPDLIVPELANMPALIRTWELKSDEGIHIHFYEGKPQSSLFHPPIGTIELMHAIGVIQDLWMQVNKGQEN